MGSGVGWGERRLRGGLVDDAGDGEDRRNGCGEDGVLKGEGGFGSALPEAGEEHEEEAKLSEEEHGPDTGLGEHVHRGAGGEEDGGDSEDGEEEEDGPGLSEVVAEEFARRGRGRGGRGGRAWRGFQRRWSGGRGRVGRCRPRRDRSRDGGSRRRGGRG